MRHPAVGAPRDTKCSEDLQAAIDVLARRTETYIPLRWLNSPVDLSHSDLSRLWMAGGHYEGGYFPDCNFVQTELANAHLYKANFDRSNLTGTNLSGADMRSASLRDIATAVDANFSNTDLREADFSGSNLKGANFTGANISKTNFENAVVDVDGLAKTSGECEKQPRKVAS
jgi:uncharacterized protein YjbI with pentapeptide repeats